MTVTIRPLPTAHDVPDGPVTVATPSCCCCCCCCLATLGGAIGVAAGAAYETGTVHGRPRWAAVTIAALALPLALVVLIAGIDAVGGGPGDLGEALRSVPVALAILVYVVVCAGALHLAGADPWRAVGTPIVVLLVGGGLFVVEIFGALITGFVIELFAPVAVWLGVLVGRTTHRPAARSWPAPPGDRP